MGEEVKVLGMWASPFSRRVEIALKLKGVDYELIEEDLSNKSPLLLKYNPLHKNVPVLVHHGNPIVESLAILEYIDETWKRNPLLLPQDPHERANARFWAKFIDEKCIIAVRSTIRGGGGEEAAKGVQEALKVLENELKEKRFFGGASIGLVDIAASPVPLWVSVIQEVVGLELLNPEKLPKLCKWADELMGCSAVAELMPPRDELLAHFKARFEAATSRTK